MRTLFGRKVGLAAGLFLVCFGCLAALAQDKAASKSPQPKKLVAGVLTTIPATPEEEETFSGPRPAVEYIAEYGEGGEPTWKPNLGPAEGLLVNRAKGLTVYGHIWQLEIAFKPVRLIQVDIPQPSGKFQRKQIYYLVYRLTNPGRHLKSIEGPADEWGQKRREIHPVDVTVGPMGNGVPMFAPNFMLESLQMNVAYRDRIIPQAVAAIQEREDKALKFYNTVEISSVPIKVSTPTVDNSVWGVATWEDIDPRINFFSVYIQGLTNALKFVDPPGAYQKGDPIAKGRTYTYRTLQLNFYRTGDAFDQHEEEIHFGVPLRSDPDEQVKYLRYYNLGKEPLDYLWVYR